MCSLRVQCKRAVTHHVAVMSFSHEKHSSHQVSGGDALCAFTFPVTAFTLHLFISVLTIHCQRDVIWKTRTTTTAHHHIWRLVHIMRVSTLPEK